MVKLPNPMPKADELVSESSRAVLDSYAKALGLDASEYSNKADIAKAIVAKSKSPGGSTPPGNEQWKDWPNTAQPTPVTRGPSVSTPVLVPGKDVSLCVSCVNSCKAPMFAQKCGQYRTADGLLH
jgi:hypothetical protein